MNNLDSRVEDEKSLAEILEDNTPAGSEIVVEEQVKEDAAEGDQAADFIDSTASGVLVFKFLAPILILLYKAALYICMPHLGMNRFHFFK